MHHITLHYNTLAYIGRIVVIDNFFYLDSGDCCTFTEMLRHVDLG